MPQYVTPPQMNKKQCRQKTRVYEIWSNERKHVKTVIGFNGAARYTPQICKPYSHDSTKMYSVWQRAGVSCELNNLKAKWGYGKLFPCVAAEHCAASSGRMETNGPQRVLAVLRSHSASQANPTFLGRQTYITGTPMLAIVRRSHATNSHQIFLHSF